MKAKKTNNKFTFIFIGLAVVGLGYGGYKYIHSLSHETTDDAQVAKKMNPIIPRVSGYITKVLVKDNDNVKQGDTLFVIDNSDYLVKVEEAKANLAAAENNYEVAKADIGTSQAGVSVSEANVQSAGGSIETAKIRLRRASSDFERYNNLYKNHSITKQQFEQAEAAKQEAQSQLNILMNQQKASSFQKNVAAARTNVSNKQVLVAAANIKKAQAALDAANLNIGYTVVTASIDGQVSTINIQPGQLVQPGQSLFYIINNNETWVVANFKETQLDKMREGQKVKLKIDAFPGTEFEGQIVSFSPATGSKFSLLPPDNASGNFVKTVQRLPVRINFTDNNAKDKVALLRSGMNADVDVILK
ncbi:HlyD family secretion protein [Flavobacterium sp.]|uniref:HlyD family secretion protein n=1 Tax=Flavobacterium sp. TaxID=239 RepID=UPI002488FB24|nr:HlyD family secretion protein [Flavobacterium sp.]MDI1316258.1 HlyD family secretion protein [Flavobacterium sp.]